MGHVKDYVRSELTKEIDKNGVVLWFDPEKSYAEFAANLELNGTHVALLKDSYFALRREIEPYLSSAERPKLLVYVPVEDRKSTRLNSSHSQISYAVFCLKK